MSFYDQLRHLADSYGLVALLLLFLSLCLWVFRPGAKQRNREAARSIFDDGETEGRNDGQ
ncbi:CcoQ/FixQ family Cbb3-type cytochrome c oxidase assembly chaperone [Sphingomicrobium sp. XHP0235]|uniref:CcoQ/FixQ family Cbb3-type cytochrome c oxidase assembly chaperone n=1 Tax=Sphingomicrobium aquimarinum TaxID=3133971 RepID=UPI0031FE723C